MLLDEAQRLGGQGSVSDEGEFWETRSLERLTKEIGDGSAILAGMLGLLKDAADQVPGAVEAPITDYPNFEHSEADGQRRPRLLFNRRRRLSSPPSIKG